MTTTGLNLTPGDLAYWKRQLEREAQMRRYGNNIQSQVPAHIRQALEQQAAPQSSRDYPWPGQYPTHTDELPKDITELPDWSEDDIRQLDPQIRQELFGSWQTSLIPATIKIAKIFKREEEDKQVQAQIEQAKKVGYMVMGDGQNKTQLKPNQYNQKIAFLDPTTEPPNEGNATTYHWSEEEFPEDEKGFHEYTVGPNKVCDANLNCSAEFMLDVHRRFAYPGQDPSSPVEDLEQNMVIDTRTGMEGGMIETTISEGGYVITNETLGADEEEGRPEHVFHHGIIERTLYEEDGNWFVETYGRGNNRNGIYAWINENQGVPIFERVDRAMAYYVFLNE